MMKRASALVKTFVFGSWHSEANHKSASREELAAVSRSQMTIRVGYRSSPVFPSFWSARLDDTFEPMPISRRVFLATSAVAVATRRLDAALPPLLPAGPRSQFDPWLEIDATAIAHNVRTLSRLSNGRRIIAVAKNNAYGCGIATVGPVLEPLPEVAGFAVVRSDEARTLRRSGVRKPV